MSVALRHADLGMPEQSLDDIERYAAVHQETRKRMTQVMEPNIGQTCATSNAVPRIEQRCEGTASQRRREDVLAAFPTLKRLQERHGCLAKCNGSRSPGFRQGHQQCVSLPVDVLPFCLGNFVAPCAGEQQQLDRLGGDLVGVFVDSGDEALGLLGGQEALPMDLGAILRLAVGLTPTFNTFHLRARLKMYRSSTKRRLVVPGA